MHPGCSWEVFLTFLARPGPALLMRSQPRAWAVSPPIPPRGPRACLLHIHVHLGSCLLLPIRQLGDPPLLSPMTMPPPLDPPAPARPMCLERAPLVHPVAQGSGPEAGWTLGCVALTPTGGEFQTGKLIRDPSARPVLTPLPPEGKGQRGLCSPHPTPSPLPSPANISPSWQDRNRRASTS